jgi:glyoxylase-like metal-dependent hydrolase (beta-lactamase superfamily II)
MPAPSAAPADPASAWRIGAVTVTKVFEQDLVVAAERMFPTATVAELRAIDWLGADQLDAEGRILMSIHALVIRTPSRTIVVDTCVGDDKQGMDVARWNGMNSGFLRNFAAAGVTRDEVDTVLCTHLHADHVGWNTVWADGAWTPTFPRARYLIDRREYEHWRARTHEGEVGAVMSQSLQPVMDAGLMELIDAGRGYGICEEVSLTPTPGHTPGHVSVRISSQRELAFITGDAIHHPSQMARPDWGAVSDDDRALAERSRRELLAACETRGVLLIGTHFAGDPAGRVCRHGAVWRFEQG